MNFLKVLYDKGFMVRSVFEKEKDEGNSYNGNDNRVIQFIHAFHHLLKFNANIVLGKKESPKEKMNERKKERRNRERKREIKKLRN